MTNTKKKHGNKMKLMSAIGMLTVSAAMLVSSTFAWFSLNKDVSAKTMKITATSYNPYLQISEAPDSGYTKDLVFSPDVTPDAALKLVTPLNAPTLVAYYADAAAATAGTTTTPTAKVAANAEPLWGATYSSQVDDAEGNNTTTQVPVADLDGYRLKKDLYFTVVANTTNGTDLTCTKVKFATDATTDADKNGIRNSGRLLLVSSTGKIQLFKFNAAGEVTTAETGSDTALLATVTDTASSTTQKVTAYFYFDGTDASAKTTNAVNLDDDLSVELYFGISNTVG